MTFGVILLVLLPIAVIAYIVWDYRRKMAQRAAVSAGRLTELMGAVKEVQLSASAPPPPTDKPTVPPVAPTPPPVTRAEPEPTKPEPPLYAARERMLSPPQTLLYYLLRTGLPEHIVLARVSLAAVLDAGPGLSGFARDEQTRRLAALTIDFVVADRSMRPVAVVEIAAPDQGSVAESDRESVRTRLAAAGVRYVELDARKLPRKEGIRAVVLGDAQTAATPPKSAAAAR